MIGSLDQFLPLTQKSILAQLVLQNEEHSDLSPIKIPRRRGKTTFDNYIPVDKSELLQKYQRNNIFSTNKKKYHSILEDVKGKDQRRKPLVEHRSFFVKPQISRDYIAKEELKRKHNLLRAILRMKQSQEEPKGESDYEQSFQRLYSGFKNIHPNPILAPVKSNNLPETQLTLQKHMSPLNIRTPSGLSNRKRIQYQHCLSWAKKHNKKGDFFAKKLGKYQNRDVEQKIIANRSLIDQISKKIEFKQED